jgi:hypothetical protein
MRHRWTLSVAVFLLVAIASTRSAIAQGDGARAHGKELLTETNMFSFTFMIASGNANPADPAHTVYPDAEFTAHLGVLGYSRSFALFDRTAVGSILMPFGGIDGEIADPVSQGDSANGFGDPILQLDLNLFGAPAMVNLPGLLRYEPDFTVDLVLDLAIPIGEYDNDSPVNIGQNRWYGRIGVPMMASLGDWVPGNKTTLELLPALWVFGDNDDFLGEKVENDPLFQLEAHLTHDFAEAFWGSLDAVWYLGAKSTLAGHESGEKLNNVSLGFTLGFEINDSLMLTAGYSSTIGSGSRSLDLGMFHISLVFGWHELIEGINRLAE